MRALTILSILALLFSCQQDDLTGSNGNSGNQNDQQNDIEFQQNFGNNISANFLGIIVNSEGQPVEGATVSIGSIFTSTDANGIFNLSEVTVFEKFAFVKVQKEGFINGSRTLIPNTEGSNIVRITLLEKNVVATINSGELSEVNFEGNRVEFTGDFIDAQGDPYEGEVEVSMHYLRPNQSETFDRMPGMLFGQELDNDAVAMETYGMLAVDLFSASGERLNIQPDSPSTVEFAVDETQTSIAPDAINLWSFDEEVGYWKEEGIAQRLGNKYIAEVSHFSWWNCDIPLDYQEACFSIFLNGNLWPGAKVLVTRNATGQIIFYGHTNDRGMACGLFPNNEDVTFIVYGTNECLDFSIHEEVIAINETTNSIQIFATQTIIETNIIGTALNCIGEPIDNGYFLFVEVGESNNYNFSYLQYINNGVIDFNSTFCLESSYNIYLFNLDDGESSEVLSIEMQEGTTNLGEISTCIQNEGTIEGNVTLRNQSDVDAFGALNVSTIIGDLVLGYDLGFQESNISSLLPLALLTEVTGEIKISVCPQLIELNGLNNLQEAFSLYLIENINLNDISALSNLSQGLNQLYIFRCNSLINFQGLNSLNFVYNLTIIDNSSLQSLEGLNGLNNITFINLNDNSSLQDISGLGNSVISEYVNLQSNFLLSDLSEMNITPDLRGVVISNCPLVNSVDFLSVLVSAEYIILEGLDQLSTLNSLSNFSTLVDPFGSSSEYLSINNNIGLTDLCGLQNVLSNSDYSIGNIIIENNAFNPTVQDIIDGNCAQ